MGGADPASLPGLAPGRFWPQRPHLPNIVPAAMSGERLPCVEGLLDLVHDPLGVLNLDDETAVVLVRPLNHHRLISVMHVPEDPVRLLPHPPDRPNRRVIPSPRCTDAQPRVFATNVPI